MQSFFISIANLLSQLWDYISHAFEQFFSLFQSLVARVGFVIKSANLLPDEVRIPAMAILGVMLIKFILSFGKQ